MTATRGCSRVGTGQAIAAQLLGVVSLTSECRRTIWPSRPRSGWACAVENFFERHMLLNFRDKGWAQAGSPFGQPVGRAQRPATRQ